MYFLDDLSPNLLAALGIIMLEENFIEQRKPSEYYGHDKSEHVNSEHSRETF